jgi:hypothetical protein
VVLFLKDGLRSKSEAVDRISRFAILYILSTCSIFLSVLILKEILGYDQTQSETVDRIQISILLYYIQSIILTHPVQRVYELLFSHYFLLTVSAQICKWKLRHFTTTYISIAEHPKWRCPSTIAFASCVEYLDTVVSSWRFFFVLFYVLPHLGTELPIVSVSGSRIFRTFYLPMWNLNSSSSAL